MSSKGRLGMSSNKRKTATN